MTELTQEQRATLERAQERKGKTTPAPWGLFNPSVHSYRPARKGWQSMGNETTEVLGIDIDVVANEIWFEIGNSTDAELITDAPNLDDLAIAQAAIITEQAAQLERRHRENLNRENRKPWFLLTGELIPDDKLDAYYEGLDDGLYNRHEKWDLEVEALNNKITEQGARIAALEAKQTIIPPPRIQVYESNTLGIGKRWFYSVHIGHVPVSNNKSAPTEAEAYECANKAVEYYLNRLTGKSSEWGSY